jgi:hypothetical protein
MRERLFSLATPRLAPSISLLATLLSSPTTAVSYVCNIKEDQKLMFGSGHYIENTSETEKLIWIELYKSDRVADISLAQWLALTPADTVANVLKVDIEVIHQIKKQKQILVPGK